MSETDTGWRLFGGPRTIEVPCTVEIEHTPASLHAHAIPQGIVLRPGDRVLVHGVPPGIPFGQTASFETRATVTRAGPLTQIWTRISAFVELTELYHVGFEPKEAP